MIRRFVRLLVVDTLPLYITLGSVEDNNRTYRDSLAHQDPIQRNIPASHGTVRSSHCIAPNQGNEGILFHNAEMANIAT